MEYLARMGKEGDKNLDKTRGGDKNGGGADGLRRVLAAGTPDIRHLIRSGLLQDDLALKGLQFHGIHRT